MQPRRDPLRLRLKTVAIGAALAALLAPPVLQAQQHTNLEDPIPALIPQSPVRIALQPILSGLVSPVAAATTRADRYHLYVADQIGQVWRIPLSPGNDQDPRATALRTSQAELFLDVRSMLVKLGIPPSNYDERGLLGIAFHPEFRYNGLFYTFTSQPV